MAFAVALACAGHVSALTFTASGSIDSFTATIDGTYRINAWGAQGGTWGPVAGGGLGGRGAMVGGNIFLHAGENLSLVVGGVGGGGSNLAMGGGGASWVYLSSNMELLLAAGGGGGGGWACCDGSDGLASTLGGGIGNGGSAGGGGGGGAGWLGAGGGIGSPEDIGFPRGLGGSSLTSFEGGRTVGCVYYNFPNECYNVVTGGFGGGGGAGWSSGGGGGGASGGAGGGGGGTSYIAESFADPISQSGVRWGGGVITIDMITAESGAVPEPSTWAMMSLGFGGMGAFLRRQRRHARLGPVRAT